MFPPSHRRGFFISLKEAVSHREAPLPRERLVAFTDCKKLGMKSSTVRSWNSRNKWDYSHIMLQSKLQCCNTQQRNKVKLQRGKLLQLQRGTFYTDEPHPVPQRTLKLFDPLSGINIEATMLQASL
ncbi:MAG: phage terminase small subunit-related protein [Saccharofermentanales bacterium]